MFWHLSVFLPEVTKILLFAAQASHQLVPPEVSVHLCAMFNGQQASMGMLCVWGEGERELVRLFGKAYGHFSYFLQVPRDCFIKGRKKRCLSYFLQENWCLENICGLYWHVLMCLSMRKDLSVNNI